MKIRIEVDPALQQDELIIRCRQVTDDIRRLEQMALQGAEPNLAFYKDDEEYFFPLGEVLFFETEGEAVWAHTPAEAYRTKLRLYELEAILPRPFIRAAKSTIVNTGKIYSIRQGVATASLISFSGTHKQVYASRHYYKALKERILERSTT